jgi:hypothetical protein
MKNTLFLILIVGVFCAVSCKKKSPQENCYALFVYDSVYSKYDPSLSQKQVKNGPYEYCGWTAEMAREFVKQKTFNDTLIYVQDAVHDTLVIKIQTAATDLW